MSHGELPGLFPGLGSEPELRLRLCDEEGTRRLGRSLGLRARELGFVGLIGELGAGKTTLMQGVVEGLGGEAREVTSPTYSLVQIYETSTRVYHLDLYRLDTWDDLESIGYWDLLEDWGALVCVEWLDSIPGAWPEEGIVIRLSQDGSGRVAEIWSTPGLAELVKEMAG